MLTYIYECLLKFTCISRIQTCLFAFSSQNNIFFEPENVQYLDGGGVQQTDGQYRPTRDRFGGANYFDRESQILYIVRQLFHNVL